MSDAPPSEPHGSPAPSAVDLAAAIVDTSLLGYCTTDADLRLTYVNPALARILGAPADELLGTPGLDLVHPSDRPMAAEAVTQFLDGTDRHRDVGVPLRFRLLRADGTPVTMELGALALLDHPVISGFAIRIVPLRGQGEIDAALRAMARDAELSEILDLLLDAIDEVVGDGRATLVVDEQPSHAQWSMPEDVEPALRELPGPTDADDGSHPGAAALDAGSVVVRVVDDLPPGLRSAAEAAGYRAVWAFPLTTKTFRAVVLVWRTEAREPLISTRETIDRTLGIIGLAIERHRARMVLEHAATHDPLTGLSNRSAFASEIGRPAASGSAPTVRGVLYLDLDGFKAVNDEHGHRAGDSVLREAAARIIGAVRDSDVVARVGGDEFSVLCPDLESADVLPIVAERIIRAFEEPFVLERTTVRIGVSIGIAAGEAVAGAELDPDELLARADGALYEAKRAGRGRWAVAI